MLDYIKGTVTELNPASVVVETGGLGYLAHISLNTYSALGGKNEIKLFVYEVIREDAHLLFGFFDRQERNLFLHLISVSGVGPNTARMVLSSLSPPELETVIVGGNANALKMIKGIGAKTAERIIIDLKDKVKLSGEQAIGRAAAPVNPNAQEAVAALVMLGFNQAASQKVIQKIEKENPQFTVEEMIKVALKSL